MSLLLHLQFIVLLMTNNEMQPQPGQDGNRSVIQMVTKTVKTWSTTKAACFYVFY